MTRLTFALLACLILAACARPLTPAEQDFMAGLTGDSFDPAPVRIGENHLIGLTSLTYPARPRVTCRERIFPEPSEPYVTGRVAGLVLFNRLRTRPDFFLEDYIAREDGALNLLATMFFAHEMTHVWQWQNRHVTGYHPRRALSEHLTTEDPYLFDGDAGHDFLAYGYEQQASLMEEYVCCRALDPQGARTERLRNLLANHMEINDNIRLLDDLEILLPWDGAQTRGICS